MSGLYFFGSGERLATICGGDRRGSAAAAPQRLCADGTIVPRNSFVRDAIHRVDMRLQQRIPLGGRVSIDGIFEVFNVFNRANFGSYVDRPEQPALRAAEREHEPRVRAAHAAARLPGDVLRRIACGWWGGSARQTRPTFVRGSARPPLRRVEFLLAS